jgi:hydrogenase expression/formation protein HypD
VVPEHGNPAALAAIAEVYEPRDAFDWRGLGEIDRSGVRLRDRYAAHDAELRFAVGYGAGKRSGREAELAQGCRCGEVVKGMIKPWACPKFALDCTPETPLGPLMVSSEGACAAYHLYAGVRSGAPTALPERAAP